MNRDPAVERWLDGADHPLDPALRRAREIILGVDDRITESVKWKTPTFAYKGNIASFMPAKNVVSINVPLRDRAPGRPSPARGRREARSHHALREPRGARSRPSRSRGGHPGLVRLEGLCG